MRQTFTFLALTLSAAVMAADSPLDLRYHLSPKAAFYFDTQMKLSGEVKSPGDPKPDKVQADLRMTQGLLVSGIDEKTGNVSLENRLQNYVMTIAGTETKAGDVAAITMKITPLGKVIEMVGLDALIQSKGAPGLDPTTFSSIFYNFPAFPKEGAKPGDSWNDEVPVALPTGQKVNAKRKMTLIGVEDAKEGGKNARIRTETTLAIDVSVDGASGGTMKGSQTGIGESKISLADGLPLESKTDLKMAISAKPNQAPKDEKGKPIEGTVEVITSLHMESRRLKEAPKPEKASTENSEDAKSQPDGWDKASVDDKR